MIQQPSLDVYDQVSNWATEKYAGAAPSLNAATGSPTGVAAPLLGAVATPGSDTQTSTTGTVAFNGPSSTSNNGSAWSAAKYTPTIVDPNGLATRNVDKATETVQGQLGGLLQENSQVLQQAKADAQRTAFDRGLGNSMMAASAGTDAMLRSATNIAGADAATYSKANDYNAAVKNQATMANVETLNSAAQANAQLSQQMSIAQMNDSTQRWQQEMQTATSRYNTDLNYKKDVDNQRLGVANNIIANMELSPDRKAAMLEQLGFGTMARNGQPGTGLAGAAYVIDSVGYELGGGGGSDGYQPLGLSERPGGTMGGMMYDVAERAHDQAMDRVREQDQENWGSGRMNNSSDYYFYQP
jgi:hypothetical protein